MSQLIVRSFAPEVVGDINMQSFDERARELLATVPLIEDIVTTEGYFDIGTRPDDDSQEIKDIAGDVHSELLRWFPDTITRSTPELERLLSGIDRVDPQTVSFRIENALTPLRVDRFHCDTLSAIPWPTMFASNCMLTQTFTGDVYVEGLEDVDAGTIDSAQAISYVGNYLKGSPFQADIEEELTADPGSDNQLRPVDTLLQSNVYVINGIHRRQDDYGGTRAGLASGDIVPRLSIRYILHERDSYPNQVMLV